MTDTHPLGQVLQEADGSYTVRFERRFAHPIARVWQAITDPDKVAVWLGLMQLDPRVGGRFELRFHDTDAYFMVGQVAEIDPPHRLAYGWKAADMPENPIRWELTEDGPEATRVIFSFGNVHSRAAGAAAGWQQSLDRLEETLDGTRTVHRPFDMALNAAREKAYRAMSDGQAGAGCEPLLEAGKA